MLNFQASFHGSCGLGIGQGEPTVHIPVNALTTESHTTQTVTGNYNKAATTTNGASPTAAPDAGPSSATQGTAPAGASITAVTGQQGTPNGAGATPATSPNAGQPGTTAAAGTSPAGGVASPAPGTGTGQQGTTAVGGGSVGQSPSTDAGQPGSPSSAAGSASSPANAPTTAPQPTGVNPASQGEPKGTTTSAVAFTYIPPRTTSPAAVTFGTIVATQNSASNSVIGSTTLVPGGAAATFGDTSVFLVSGRSAAVVNGKTSAIVEPSSTPAVDIGGATLVAGDAAATFGVSTVALASGGTGLIVNGKTSPLAAATARRFWSARRL